MTILKNYGEWLLPNDVESLNKIIVLTSVLSEYGDLNPSQAAIVVLKSDGA